MRPANRRIPNSPRAWVLVIPQPHNSSRTQGTRIMATLANSTVANTINPSGAIRLACNTLGTPTIQTRNNNLVTLLRQFKVACRKQATCKLVTPPRTHSKTKRKRKVAHRTLVAGNRKAQC